MAAVISPLISAAAIAKVLSGIDFQVKDSLKQYAKDHISKAEVEDAEAAEAALYVLDDLPAR
jgi:hypothetical protein